MAETAIIKFRVKKYYILVFFIALFLLISCIRWQLIRASEFKLIANSRLYSSDLKSLRGTVYSSDGSTLAYSEPRFDMYVWLDDLTFFEKQGIQTREEFLAKVAPIIDMTPEAMGKKIDEFAKQGVKWMPMAKSLTEEQWRKLIDLRTDLSDSLEIRGFSFEFTSERVYPEGKLAAHVIGLTQKYNNYIKGQSGIERSWDGDLSPTKGLVIKENDASGKAVASALVATIEPKPGSEIYTSINKKLQTKVEAELQSLVKAYSAESGSVIIANPKTGAIMAMASYPTYDPNLRETEDKTAFDNRSVTYPIEPGSIMKTLTISAAIDLGKITPDTVVLPDGHQGCKEYEEFRGDLGALCTWDKGPQGPMTARDCLIKSDNICFYEIAKTMSKEEFYNYLVKFGIGQSSGIDLIEESIGFLPDYLSWTAGDVSAFSYGHGYQVNMVQAISAIGSIANKGVRMKPHIVTKVVKADGEVKYQEPVAIERTISEQSAETVSQMMEAVYQNNVVEQYFAHLRAYPIGWKTGSALIAVPGVGYTSDLNNTIVGFDASEDATFVMLFTLEKPSGGLSWYNIRPAWLQLFNAIKEDIGIKPIY